MLNLSIGIAALLVPFFFALFGAKLLVQISPTHRRLVAARKHIDLSALANNETSKFFTRNGATVLELRSASCAQLIEFKPHIPTSAQFGDAIVLSHYAEEAIDDVVYTTERAGYFLTLFMLVALGAFLTGPDAGSLLDTNDALTRFGAWIVEKHLIPIGEVVALFFALVVLHHAIGSFRRMSKKIIF